MYKRISNQTGYENLLDDKTYQHAKQLVYLKVVNKLLSVNGGALQNEYVWTKYGCCLYDSPVVAISQFKVQSIQEYN